MELAVRINLGEMLTQGKMGHGSGRLAESVRKTFLVSDIPLIGKVSTDLEGVPNQKTRPEGGVARASSFYLGRVLRFQNRENVRPKTTQSGPTRTSALSLLKIGSGESTARRQPRDLRAEGAVGV